MPRAADGFTVGQDAFIPRGGAGARPSPIPSLCTPFTRAGTEWRRYNMLFAWRGHTKSLTTRARPCPDLVVYLE